MKMDVAQIKEALLMLERTNGIQEETALEALKEGIVKAYKREVGIDEMPVELTFDLERGVIELARLYAVVRDVEDEYLEISLEDANKNKEGKVYNLGDYYPVYADLNQLRSATLRSIKSIFSQKIKEVEKGNLYEAFKDKIGTMITGKVETIDDRGASVNVSGTSIFLPRREMIGDEKFAAGSSIKLYVNKVDNTKKLQIDISRACPGFLEALFKEEISDVYNGNIVIKKIARQAGERSKVAVYSEDPNVDPAGACIGPNGSRVQKIVSSLGNGENKEKVDVIQYSDNPSLFILEALKPARVAGIKMSDDPEVKECTAVVKDDSLSLAIGKKGVNVRLAVNLTGYKIDIKTESEAEEEGFTYTTTEELQSLAASIKAEKISELQKKELAKASNATSVLPGLPEGYVAPQQRIYEAEKNDFDDVLVAASEEEEETPIAPVTEEKEEVKEESPASNEVKEEKKEEAPVEYTAVKTTTSLSDLEASLEADAKKSQDKAKKSFKNKKKEEEKKEEAAPLTPTGPQMSIYTDEELKAFEEEELEEEDNFDDDVDYDDYDEYYDEDR
ncbi:MAG: transcription termination factor NusA [Erysipelotrichaceae bacterium]|nr:transcription termination factor NusA [Erysipelotrichaceae bacterium]